ncbi:putative toxin-antitoxin system toxin component, PIN family [Candidatus Micrarchaeota archaeon]|nr:putative toxin-antitoxin system toxin component, PIN family [Candidatus Micrarchaeota archaeon]
MRVVLDTNILVSATQWDGSEADKKIRALHKTHATLLVSKEILEELQSVLHRDFEYQTREVQDATSRVTALTNIVAVTTVIHAVKDDPEDDKVLACAVDGHATHILTYDRHLLKLKEFRGIQIIRPEELRL